MLCECDKNAVKLGLEAVAARMKALVATSEFFQLRLDIDERDVARTQQRDSELYQREIETLESRLMAKTEVVLNLVENAEAMETELLVVKTAAMLCNHKLSQESMQARFVAGMTNILDMLDESDYEFRGFPIVEIHGRPHTARTFTRHDLVSMGFVNL